MKQYNKFAIYFVPFGCILALGLSLLLPSPYGVVSFCVGITSLLFLGFSAPVWILRLPASFRLIKIADHFAESKVNEDISATTTIKQACNQALLGERIVLSLRTKDGFKEIGNEIRTIFGVTVVLVLIGLLIIVLPQAATTKMSVLELLQIFESRAAAFWALPIVEVFGGYVAFKSYGMMVTLLERNDAAIKLAELEIN